MMPPRAGQAADPVSGFQAHLRQRVTLGTERTWEPGASRATPGQARIDAADAHRADCEQHHPVTVLQNEGPLGFVLGHDPQTGAPIYRPGSGVVAGTGTADDPYIIAGWCLMSSWVLPLEAIMIADTDAHVVIRDNEITMPSSLGIGVYGARNVVVERNLLRSQTTAVLVSDTLGVTVRDNTVEDSGVGVGLLNAQGIVVDDNRITGAWTDGIRLWESTGNVVTANTVTESNRGLWGYASSGNDIRDNVFAGGGDGIVLFSCGPHLIEANEVTSNYWSGVTFSETTGAVVRDNNLEHNGFAVHGPEPAHYTHDIDTSNLVNGEPVRYVTGAESVVVTGPAGQVIVAGSRDVTVTDLVMAGGAGLVIAMSEDVRVTGVVITHGPVGIAVTHSRGVEVRDSEVRLTGWAMPVYQGGGHVVEGNTFAENAVDVEVDESDGNVVRGNATFDTGYVPIRLMDAVDNVVEDNVLTRGERWGIGLWNASDSVIRGNVITGHVGPQNDGGGIILNFLSSRNQIVGNTIADSYSDGVRLEFSSEDNVVEGNVITGVFWGVVAFTTGNEIRRNHVAADDLGVFVNHSSGRNDVIANTLTGSRAAVRIAAGSGHVVTDNNIWDNQSGLEAPSGLESTDARSNWWGCADGPAHPTCDGVSGTVNYTPWRQEPNPGAGPGS